MVPVDAVPEFETVEESVTAVPLVAAVGVTEPAVRLGAVAAVTEIGNHAPQLSPSSVSVTALWVSAQMRAYVVPTDGKVYESVAALLAPAA